MDSATIHNRRQALERTIRISELAGATGLPVATIKYYLREGLLPPGRRTAPNQADYDDAHVRRLRLIRVLREVGNVPVDVIAQVLEAIDDPGRPLHEVLGTAHRALAPPPPSAPSAAATAVVGGLLDELGWEVAEDAPDRARLAAAVDALDELGFPLPEDGLALYARTVEPLAAAEVASVPRDAPRETAVEHVAIGTVVMGNALAALRRLAQEHHSGRADAS